MNDSFKKWQDFYLTACRSGGEQLHPSENLVRMLKGKYITNFNPDYKGKKIVDIGFGSANNIPLLHNLGLKVYGTEVTKDICKFYHDKLSQLNIDVVLKQGQNTGLPFDDNFFDFLISWNVIHYESDENNMIKAINEYSRILKPGGRFFLSSTGPKHYITEGSESLGPHLYKIKRKDTFRKDEVYFYFDDEQSINYYFSNKFKDIEIGRTTTSLFTKCIDWFLVTGIKK
jgi:ubiquinone/menaquinone biosynthesis C-methylase UbiE